MQPHKKKTSKHIHQLPIRIHTNTQTIHSMLTLFWMGDWLDGQRMGGGKKYPPTKNSTYTMSKAK